MIKRRSEINVINNEDKENEGDGNKDDENGDGKRKMMKTVQTKRIISDKDDTAKIEDGVMMKMKRKMNVITKICDGEIKKKDDDVK